MTVSKFTFRRLARPDAAASSAPAAEPRRPKAPTGSASEALGLLRMARSRAEPIRSVPEDWSARDLLRQENRRSIVETIEKRPGINLSELKAATGIGWGTLQHHLRILERAGLVRRLTLGRGAFLFLSQMPAAEQLRHAVLRNEAARRLAAMILETPHRIQRDLCARLKMSRKVFLAHVRLLRAAGLVRVRQRLVRKEYYPAPNLESCLRETSSGEKHGPGVP